MSGPEENATAASRSLPLKIIKSLMAALALALPIALVHPIQIHTANAYEFDLALTDLILDLVLSAAVMASIISAVLVAAPWRWHRRLVVITVGVALAVWVQGQLLVWEYGVLDGTTPEWGEFTSAVVIDTLVWLLIGIAAVILRRHIYGQAVWVSSALLLIQVLPAANDLRSQPDIPEFHRYQFDETHKFSFSQNENVIVLMLDAFQTDIFQEILAEEPEIADSLEGFTYFRNALAGYSKTYPSVALMMSGQWYENDIPIQRFIKESFEKGSVPEALLRKGWRVDFFPHVKRVVQVSPDVASNAVPMFECATARSEAGQLLDLGFFRVSPHWLKSYWLDGYDWRFSRYLPVVCRIGSDRAPSRRAAEPRSDASHAALRFLEDAQATLNADLPENAFKFYHLMIPHAPFQLNEELIAADLPAGPEGFRRQSRSTVELLMRFLDALKASGVYDNAMILVLSDHGGGEYVRRVNLDLIDGEHDEDVSRHERIPGHHLASGLPLILVKRPGERGKLQISNAPVSLADIAATMASELDFRVDYPGENIFNVEESAARKRRYFFFEFEGWGSVYLPAMTEYLVDGFSWFDDNWQPSGRVLEPAVIPERSVPQEFQLGETIRFRPGSPFIDMLGAGWSEPHADGLVWSDARQAELDIALGEQVYGPLVAQFDFLPFTARGAIDSPRIEVEVNGVLSYAWTSDRRDWHELWIPEAVASESDSLSFRFRFPDAASPFEHDLSGDKRTLGIALYRLRIKKAADEMRQ